MATRRAYTTLEEFKAQLMRDPEFRKVYEDSLPEFNFVREILRARVKRKMTQQQLAEKAGTSQSRIARIEHADDNPSLDEMKRIAAALDCTLEIKLVPRRKRAASKTKGPKTPNGKGQSIAASAAP